MPARMNQGGEGETLKRGNFSNVNLPIVVPFFNVALEDFIICFAIGMIGNGASSLVSMVWEAAAVFFTIVGVVAAISLYAFAYKKRKAEIKMRGYSRIGIIRRYFAFILGGDWLLGR